MENLTKVKHLKSIVVDGVKIGNVGVKLENSQTDKERKFQEEEDLCTSIIKGLARRNRIVKNTRYWQRLEAKTKASCALMT